MINNVVLIGRITKDAELRKTPTGISTVSFTLAVNRKFTPEGGQQADFINCVAWRQSADFMANYVKQGALLSAEGRIQTRSYKDQNDRTVYVTEVVCDSVQILSQKQSDVEQKQTVNTNTSERNLEATRNLYGSDTLDITGDDLPF